MSLRLIKSILELENYQVMAVTSGQAAIDMITEQSYDLILMDLRMSQLDGISTTKIIRSQGVKTPVVAVTANEFSGDKLKCLEFMDDYLVKPYEKKELFEIVKKWL